MQQTYQLARCGPSRLHDEGQELCVNEQDLIALESPSVVLKRDGVVVVVEREKIRYGIGANEGHDKSRYARETKSQHSCLIFRGKVPVRNSAAGESEDVILPEYLTIALRLYTSTCVMPRLIAIRLYRYCCWLYADSAAIMQH